MGYDTDGTGWWHSLWCLLQHPSLQHRKAFAYIIQKSGDRSRVLPFRTRPVQKNARTGLRTGRTGRIHNGNEGLVIDVG
jgi:hypothetical protein